ncbi:unnamed protein product [Symbiodinium microadriaticum]|nr:unnamed protein product [Symbiodinium microadriaticum]
MVTSSGYALLAALLPWIVCSIRGVLEPEGSDPEEVPKDEDRLQCLRQDNLDLVGTADFASRYILRQVVGVNEDDTESDIYLFADKFRISRVQAELKLSRTGADALAFELVGSNSTEKHTGLGSADMRIREFQLVTQSSVISCATSLASSLAEDCDDPEEQQATVLFHLAGTIRAKKHKGRWEADIVTKEARAFGPIQLDDSDAQVRAVIKAVMTKAIDVIAVRAEDMGADMVAHNPYEVRLPYFLEPIAECEDNDRKTSIIMAIADLPQSSGEWPFVLRRVVLQVDGKAHAADGRGDDAAGSVFTSGSASSSAANPAHQSTVVVREVTEAASPEIGKAIAQVLIFGWWSRRQFHLAVCIIFLKQFLRLFLARGYARDGGWLSKHVRCHSFQVDGKTPPKLSFSESLRYQMGFAEDARTYLDNEMLNRSPSRSLIEKEIMPSRRHL